MGERASSVEAIESTGEAPSEVIEAQRGARTITAQAEMELRRQARSKYGNSAASQARRQSHVVSRLVSNPHLNAPTPTAPKKRPPVEVVKDDAPGRLSGTQKTVGVAAAGSIGIAALGASVPAVGEVMALAAQPMFIGTGLAAAAITYLASGITSTRNTKRFNLNVDHLEMDYPGIISAHFSGDDLADFPLSAGQCARWEFSAPGMKKQSFDGYLSCVPRNGIFRVMFIVDAALARNLRTAARNATVTFGDITGPGPESATQSVLIVAAGKGIIPARGLYESLPGGPGEMALLYRAVSPSDVMLIDELKEIGAYRRAKLDVVVGPKSRFPSDFQPLSPEHLADVAPDVCNRDVYVFGPDRMVDLVCQNLAEIGVPEDQILGESL